MARRVVAGVVKKPMKHGSSTGSKQKAPPTTGGYFRTKTKERGRK